MLRALMVHVWEIIMLSVLPVLALIEAGRRVYAAYRRWRLRRDPPTFRIL
jgi:hypothetical protein